MKMLAISPPSASTRRDIAPHILPCAIKHSGPINTTTRHWDPQSASSNADPAHVEREKHDCHGSNGSNSGSSEHVAYFRGRKLQGNATALPPGYKGYVLSKGDKILPVAAVKQDHGPIGFATNGETAEGEGGDSSEEEEANLPVHLLSRDAEFDSITVWGHEALPGADDPYVKGVNEWIALATAVSG